MGRTLLSADQVKTLGTHYPDTPQGRRNRLLVSLLLDLGMRVDDMLSLRAGDFDLTVGTVTFHRPGAAELQTHHLGHNLKEAARSYITQDVADPQAPLLRASAKGGQLADKGLTRLGVVRRVQRFGRMVGVDNLSPLDLRHTWARGTMKDVNDASA
jgi:integrase